MIITELWVGTIVLYDMCHCSRSAAGLSLETYNVAVPYSPLIVIIDRPRIVLNKLVKYQ